MKIKINGKERDFDFGLENLGKVINYANIHISELGKALENANYFLIGVPILICCGGFEAEEAKEYVKGNLYSEEMNLLIISFTESMQSFLPPVEPEGDAKKK